MTDANDTTNNDADDNKARKVTVNRRAIANAKGMPLSTFAADRLIRRARAQERKGGENE